MPQRQRRGHGGDRGNGAARTVRLGLRPEQHKLRGVEQHFRSHGYGGNGFAFSQIASEIVSASINGLDDTDARLFAFNR
ncbi:hypothetical protein B5V02_35380 [Mesorhizobium kowhaii]|uniref:Uncharacterized protein n=1 Tax=Mesorhizobium kowhaii TaxID=1300272 RepID=A0A2W7BVQ9_9HYPH|nr:hypothetical protein B5V02_35380 [Mesorhizobium kowhaii]